MAFSTPFLFSVLTLRALQSLNHSLLVCTVDFKGKKATHYHEQIATNALCGTLSPRQSIDILGIGLV